MKKVFNSLFGLFIAYSRYYYAGYFCCSGIGA